VVENENVEADLRRERAEVDRTGTSLDRGVHDDRPADGCNVTGSRCRESWPDDG
jgi:hypothetical protein